MSTGGANTPTPPPARLKLRVTAAAESAVRGGHPWVFDQSIRRQNREGTTGELAVLYDRGDEFLAIGLYDAGSPLRVRILQAGPPQTINADWWRSRLRAGLDRRAGCFGPETTGWRCLNGESDGFPGLVLDRYEDTLVLKCYTFAWMPWLDVILRLVREETGAERLVLRLSRNIQEQVAQDRGWRDGQELWGEPITGPVRFLEQGLRFEADVVRGQKTGFFLDQRENRSRVESLSAGRDVLNAFSFSGGFSLHAARGGARSVVSLDISDHALRSAERNFELNQSFPGVAACRHETVRADAFEWLNSGGPRYDLIVLDPPSLARRKADRTRALSSYGKLIESAARRLRPHGRLVAASCSAHVTAEEFLELARASVRRAHPAIHELAVTGHPPDHPATFPEANYLKCIFLELPKGVSQ
jgi:23S rRNA (cytosine1962-C5)-methyltransferase